LVTWRKLHREGKLTKEKQISSDPIREELLRLRKELEETKLEPFYLLRSSVFIIGTVADMEVLASPGKPNEVVRRS
jgi:hypothetical protein